MKTMTTLAAAALLLASATPAFAAPNEHGPAAAGGPPKLQQDLVTAKDPDGVLTALKKIGYVGELSPLDSGRSSIAVTISGLKTYIDFYDCADDMTDCYTLLFWAALDFDNGVKPEQANEWNAKQIIGRVWLDDSNDPTLDFTLSTFDGIPEDAFVKNVKNWDRVLGDFKDQFNFH